LFASLSLHFSILYFPFVLFFFKHTAPTAIYTLSLHDALPIFLLQSILLRGLRRPRALACLRHAQRPGEKILEASDDGFAILVLAAALAGDEAQYAALVDAVGELLENAGALGIVQRHGIRDVPRQLDAGR